MSYARKNNEGKTNDSARAVEVPIVVIEGFDGFDNVIRETNGGESEKNEFATNAWESGNKIEKENGGTVVGVT